MKKRATKTTDPLDSPVDFAQFGPVRRNAFAGAGERGGPSLAALWEMPELAADAVMLRPGLANARRDDPAVCPSRSAFRAWGKINVMTDRDSRDHRDHRQ